MLNIASQALLRLFGINLDLSGLGEFESPQHDACALRRVERSLSDLKERIAIHRTNTGSNGVA